MTQVIIRYASEMFGRLLYLTILLFITSCNTEDKAPVGNCKYGLKEKSNSKTSYVLMKNPVLFLGSSFGEFFQMLHKTGNYNQMLKYTANDTKSNFGNVELLNFYRNMNFSYTLKLKAVKDNTLFYQTTINATIRTIQIPFVVENDTCRVFFTVLDTNHPFKGM